MLDIRSIRSEFPVTAECVYFNCAGEGPMPLSAWDVYSRTAKRKLTPHITELNEYFDIPARCRELAAQLTGADPSEIGLTNSTNFGINTASNSIAFERGDEIVLMKGQFPCNVYPWLMLEKKGVRTVFLDYADGRIPLERINTDNCRVLAIGSVHFCSGIRADIKEVSAFCKSNDILLVVDGTQGIGVINDMHATLGVDIVACSGHKWLLSPVGTGFLYVRKGLFDAVPPVFQGWRSFNRQRHFKNLIDYSPEMNLTAERYELGSQSLEQLSAFAANMKFILDIGLENIERHVFALTDALSEIIKANGCELVSPRGEKNRSSILSFRSREGEALFDKLKENKVICSFREAAVRLSVHFFNDETDVLKFEDVLKKCV